MLTKLKEFVKEYKKDIILFVGVVLVSLLSFGSGYLAAKMEDKTPLDFENNLPL
ncbi:MAG: hypothetical protein PHW72_01955 [Candidatus Pacebacteria bacterium]|nr:hypothetical protein [Candidatus Paceibacterota bacterium]